jgi:hypothetical protein
MTARRMLAGEIFVDELLKARRPETWEMAAVDD